MRELYGIPQAEKGHENNTLGVYQPAWALWLPADPDAFFGYFRPNLIGQLSLSIAGTGKMKFKDYCSTRKPISTCKSPCLCQRQNALSTSKLVTCITLGPSTPSWQPLMGYIAALWTQP